MKKWAISYHIYEMDEDAYEYLPATVMHEMGHTAGLGHTSEVSIMAGHAMEAPSAYDVGAMKSVLGAHGH